MRDSGQPAGAGVALLRELGSVLGLTFQVQERPSDAAPFVQLLIDVPRNPARQEGLCPRRPDSRHPQRPGHLPRRRPRRHDLALQFPHQHPPGPSQRGNQPARQFRRRQQSRRHPPLLARPPHIRHPLAHCCLQCARCNRATPHLCSIFLPDFPHPHILLDRRAVERVFFVPRVARVAQR